MVVDPEILKIKPEEVRLIDYDGKMIGVFKLEKAIELSEQKELDLILLNKKQEPMVVRLGNYRKFMLEKQKKEKEKKKKKSELKEIRISFTEARHDLERKAKQVEQFLNDGHQVRIKLTLKGRQNIFKGLAKEKLEEFLQLINFSYNIIQPAKITGHILTTLISKK